MRLVDAKDRFGQTNGGERRGFEASLCGQPVPSAYDESPRLNEGSGAC